MWLLLNILSFFFILQAGVKGTLGRLVGVFEVSCRLFAVLFWFSNVNKLWSMFVNEK